MTGGRANRIIRALAVDAGVEPGGPATRVAKDVASHVAGEIAAPAAPAYEGPVASPLVGPHRAG